MNGTRGSRLIVSALLLVHACTGDGGAVGAATAALADRNVFVWGVALAGDRLLASDMPNGLWNIAAVR